MSCDVRRDRPHCRRVPSAIFGVALTVGCTALGGELPSFEPEVEPAAQRYCEVFFDCDCTVNPFEFDSVADCETEVSRDLAALVSVGEDFALTHDPTCETRLIEAFGDEGCDWTAPLTACDWPCRLYHGDKELGEPCQSTYGDMSDCAQGLSCAETCYDPCETNPDTDAPLLVDGAACSGHTQCASTHCPRGYCEPAPGEGEACPADICQPSLACEDDVCVRVASAICFAAFP